MVEKVLIAIVSSAFSVMLTAVVSMIVYPLVLREMTESAVLQHEKIWHKDNMYEWTTKQIKEHSGACGAVKDIPAIKVAVIWLVSQAGGDLHQLGLDK